MDPNLQQHIAQEQSLQRERERQAALERIQRGEKPWEQSRGVVSVVDAVRDCRFPCGVQELADQAGDREVCITEADRIALRRVLGKLKDDTFFASIKDFQTVVQKHWEGIRNLTVPPEQWPPGPRQFRPDA